MDRFEAVNECYRDLENLDKAISFERVTGHYDGDKGRRYKEILARLYDKGFREASAGRDKLGREELKFILQHHGTMYEQWKKDGGPGDYYYKFLHFLSEELPKFF